MKKMRSTIYSSIEYESSANFFGEKEYRARKKNIYRILLVSATKIIAVLFMWLLFVLPHLTINPLIFISLVVIFICIQFYSTENQIKTEYKNHANTIFECMYHACRSVGDQDVNYENSLQGIVIAVKDNIDNSGDEDEDEDEDVDKKSSYSREDNKSRRNIL